MMNTVRDLPVVDGLRLPDDLRALLRPDEPVADRSGRVHRLPRFFYEVRSWSQARELYLTSHVRVGASVYIAANGGYRSPAHRLSATASTHNWACAADVYRIGDTFLNTSAAIEKYAATAREMAPELNVLPYGHQPGESDDHLHIDLGYVHLVPPGYDEAPPITPITG